MIQHFLEEIDFEIQETDEISPIQNWGRKYIVNEESFKDGIPSEDGDIIIFTDGSKDEEDNAGAGVVMFDLVHGNIMLEKSQYLGDKLTVFQSEIYAIDMAVNHLLEANTKDTKIILHTDSYSSLQAINSNFLASRQVAAAVSKIYLLSEQNEVNIRWVKAHVGQGTEKPDEIAENLPALSRTIARGILRNKCEVVWNEWWEHHLSVAYCAQNFGFSNLPLCKGIS